MSAWPKRRESGKPPAGGPARAAAACWALSDPDRWELAKALAKERRLSQREGMRLLGLKGRNGDRAVSRWFQALEYGGLVTKSAPADDGRQREYRLTREGEVVVMALLGLEQG